MNQWPWNRAVTETASPPRPTRVEKAETINASAELSGKAQKSLPQGLLRLVVPWAMALKRKKTEPANPADRHISLRSLDIYESRRLGLYVRIIVGRDFNVAV